MPSIPQYQPTYVLRHIAGQSYAYATLKAVWDDLGYMWLRRNLGCEFNEPLQPYDNSVGVYPVQWILRTDFGEIVSIDAFEAMREAHRRRPRFFWLSYSCYGYNGEGPVPRAGRRRGGRTYRRVRHMMERRQAAAIFVEEGEVAPRAKRGLKGIPDPLNEYAIAARENRNWKQYRKNQWRERG